jgi:hypothetical protein
MPCFGVGLSVVQQLIRSLFGQQCELYGAESPPNSGVTYGVHRADYRYRISNWSTVRLSFLCVSRPPYGM